MFRSLRRKLFRLALVSGAGAAADYFFDRERGPARREKARDSVNGVLRRGETTGWQPEHTANAFEAPARPAPDPGADLVPSATEVAVAAPAEVDTLIVDPAPGVAASSGPVVP